MEPVIRELKKTYAGRVNVRVINLDNRREEDLKEAIKYKVQYVPTFVFLNSKGDLIDLHVGPMTKKDIEEVFRKMGVK
jgi:thiol-disulfide isomerase/thioredoxin